MADQKNTTYEITFDTPDLDTYQLTAAYTVVDERMFPGWVLFKDQHGAIVGKARANRTLAIARADALPDDPGNTAAAPSERPSPKQLAELAARGRKPGDV
jgi:hypothetical protein